MAVSPRSSATRKRAVAGQVIVCDAGGPKHLERRVAKGARIVCGL